MNLGEFHFGMSVKDIQQSIEFYTKLGFVPLDGDPSQGFYTMRCSNLTMTFYQGFLAGNILNFRGGDVRAIADHASQNELEIERKLEGTEDTSLSVGLKDPDGNSVYFCEYPDERKRLEEHGKIYD